MEKNTLETINLVLNALTSIGTVSAVIVALWLSKQNEKIKLSVFVGKYNVIGCNQNKTDVLRIIITNLGLRKVKISQIGWVIGIFNKSHGIQLYDHQYFDNVSLPKEIEDGESIFINLPWDSFEQQTIPSIVKSMNNFTFFKSKNFIKFKVYPSVFNKGINAIIAKEVKELFIKEIESAKLMKIKGI